MAGPFALIDRALSRGSPAAKGGGYPGVQPGAKPRKARDLNDPKTLEYLRRMHPDFDEVMVSSNVDYRTRCHTDASFASKFKIPDVVEPQQSFRGHTNSVDAVCWGPDPDSFITASHDRTLKVWDAKQGTCKSTLTGHVSGVYHCAVDGTKQLIVSCASGKEKNLLLWRWSDKSVVRGLTGHTRSVIHATFAPDGAHVASAGQDGSVIVHDVMTGSNIFRRTVHLGTCRGSSFCKENPQLLISGGVDGSLQVLDTREDVSARLLPSAVANSVHLNSTLAVREAHDGYAVHALDWFDRNTVFSGGADHKLKRWDLRQLSPFKPLCAGQYLGHTAPVRSLVVSNGGKLVVTGCEDGSLRVWPKDPLSEARSSLRAMKMELKDLDTDMQDFGRSVVERQAAADKHNQMKASISTLKKEEQHLSRDGYVPALRTLNGHVAQVSACDWQEDSGQQVARILSSSWDQTVKLFSISLGGLI